MIRKLLWPILMFIIVILASMSFAETESDYWECEDPGTGGTYRVRKVTPCSEVKTAAEEAQLFYEDPYYQKNPAEINKDVERRIKRVSLPPGGEEYELMGLYAWGCENGYIIHNDCGGSYLKKEAGGYIITAYAATYRFAYEGFTASRMLQKGYSLGMPDTYLNVSVVEKENPWMNPPSLEVIRKNYQSNPKEWRKALDSAEKLQSMANITLNEILTYLEEYKKAYCSALAALASGESLEEGIEIVIKVEAEGFEVETDKRYTEDYQPSSINITGTVRDKDGNPISQATVTLPDFGKTVTTDNQGRYTLRAEAEGKKPFNIKVNFALRKIISNLQFKLIPLEEIVANGKKHRIKLKVTAEGVPYKNRTVSIESSNGFKRKGRKIDYIDYSEYFDAKVKTNEMGEVVFSFPAPLVVKEKLSVVENPLDYFPVKGFLWIKDVSTGKDAVLPYDLESPFPHIDKFVVTGNIEEENWQITPSRVFISDKDSSRFRVMVKAVGNLKVKGGPVMKNELSEKISGNVFEFHYKPPKLGVDLNKQPELLKQILETNAQIALGLITFGLEEYSLGKAGTMFADKVSNFNVMSIDKDKVLKIGKTTMTSLDYYKTTYDTTGKLSGSSSSYDKSLAAIDWVYGGLDIVSGILDKAPKDLTTKLGYETMKALYANAKTFYSVYKQYEEINNTYQDVMFLPVAIFVEDSDGYKTMAVRKCSVRVWKK